MKLQHNLDLFTKYLQETLIGYEVIPANFGWHIHQEGSYCGLLQYQERKGWHGAALNYLPLEVTEELKKFELSDSALNAVELLALNLEAAMPEAGYNFAPLC